MPRSPAADLGPLIKLLQAGVPPERAANELSRVLAIWAAELKDDDEHLQERLSGLAEQLAIGIEEMHEGIAEASDKGKPTLRRSWRRMRRCWTGCGRRRGPGRPPTASSAASAVPTRSSSCAGA
jgi:hypothetical protein